MPVLFYCPHGHRWEAHTDDPALTGEACPVCGSVGRSAEGEDTATSGASLADELPPLPVSGPPSTNAPPRLAGGPPSVPGYEVLSELGRGGMGVVFKARQVSLNRMVALKMLLAGGWAGPQEQLRFRGEAEAVARLHHPNIVQIHDIGEHQGLLFLALELLEGDSLAQRLAVRPRKQAPDYCWAAGLIRDLALAIQHAHERGIIHRDLKPANVLFTADGLAKITDFGLARRLDVPGITATGAVMGSPSYMSPEQALGRVKDIGPAADVWALGAMFYEMLTGSPPFMGESALETLRHVIATEPAPLRKSNSGIPDDLERICLKCLRKEPRLRYASARDLAGDLQRFLDRKPPEEKRRWLGPIVLLGALAASLLTGLAGWHLLGPGPAASSAQTTREPIPGAAGWQALAIGVDDETFDRIAFPSRQVGYAASRDGLYRTSNGGRTWDRLRGSPGRAFFLRFVDNETGWLGSEDLLQTRDGGKSWKPVALPDGVEMESFTALALGPRGEMVVGGRTRSGDLLLLRSAGPAADWKPLGGGQPGYWGDSAHYRKWFPGALAIPATGQVLAAMFRGGDEGGVVMRSTDDGATWTAVLPDAPSVYRLAMIDARRGWLAGSSGRLWRTDDGGATWQPRANLAGEVTVSELAFAPDGGWGIAPLWNGKVLLTTNGEDWRVETVPLGYSMPAAAVVDPGWAFVLYADGRLAHFVDPKVKTDR